MASMYYNLTMKFAVSKHIIYNMPYVWTMRSRAGMILNVISYHICVCICIMCIYIYIYIYIYNEHH